MGATSNLGIEFPGPSATPSRVNWVENPIKSVDEKVSAALALGLRGTPFVGTVTVSSNSEVTQVIAFPITLPSAPTAVVATSTNDSFMVIQTVNYTTTGFTVRVRHKAGTSTSATVGVRGIAVL